MAGCKVEGWMHWELGVLQISYNSVYFVIWHAVFCLNSLKFIGSFQGGLEWEFNDKRDTSKH